MTGRILPAEIDKGIGREDIEAVTIEEVLVADYALRNGCLLYTSRCV